MTTKRIPSWMTALALAGALLAVMATHATAEETEHAKATFAGGLLLVRGRGVREGFWRYIGHLRLHRRERR